MAMTEGLKYLHSIRDGINEVAAEDGFDSFVQVGWVLKHVDAAIFEFLAEEQGDD